jgi:hypothetical protein
MKKIIFNALFLMSVIYVIYAVILFILQIFNIETIVLFTMSKFHLVFANVFGNAIIVFWIWSMIIWGKKDKNTKRFLLLFFLVGIYALFYYRRIIMNKWLG